MFLYFIIFSSRDIQTSPSTSPTPTNLIVMDVNHQPSPSRPPHNLHTRFDLRITPPHSPHFSRSSTDHPRPAARTTTWCTTWQQHTPPRPRQDPPAQPPLSHSSTLSSLLLSFIPIHPKPLSALLHHVPAPSSSPLITPDLFCGVSKLTAGVRCN